MIFQSREDAGKQLGEVLQKYSTEDTIVLGIPRGGVVVAAEVAKALGTPLDVIIPRKLGAPHNPEVAIGAVTPDGTIITDEIMVRRLGLSDYQIESLAGEVLEEIERRVQVYRNGKRGLNLKEKIVVVVDDGIATGFTVQAALQSVRSAGCKKLVLAVPVAPVDTVGILREKVDELVCLHAPDIFYAVGQFYRDFDQTSDREVIELLSDKAGSI